MAIQLMAVPGQRSACLVAGIMTNKGTQVAEQQLRIWAADKPTSQSTHSPLVTDLTAYSISKSRLLHVLLWPRQNVPGGPPFFF